ncbi:hypothetical protein Dimus_037857 [Dionaea muscipula]
MHNINRRIGQHKQQNSQLILSKNMNKKNITNRFCQYLKENNKSERESLTDFGGSVLNHSLHLHRIPLFLSLGLYLKISRQASDNTCGGTGEHHSAGSVSRPPRTPPRTRAEHHQRRSAKRRAREAHTPTIL